MADSIDVFIDKIGFRKFNWLIVFAIGIFWTMEGIEMTLISLVSPHLQCVWKMSSFQTGIVSSAVFVGMGIGAIYWGWLSDAHGRRVVILISSIYVLYFGILTSVTSNLVWFILVRIFVGIGIGGIGSGICYLVEFSTTIHRGKVVIAAQYFFAFGNLLAALLSYLTMNTLGWRVFVICCTIPIPFSIALVLWLPESIKYLQNTGNSDAIMKVLNFISKQSNYPLPQHLTIECGKSDNRGNFKVLLGRTYITKLPVLTILWIISWWTYFGVVLLSTNVLQHGIYNSPNVTRATNGCHELTDSEYFQNLIVVIGEFPGITFFVFVIEILGRKKSLMLAFLTTSVLYGVLAFPLTSRVSTVIMFLIRATSTTLPQILYVFTLELFPTTIRNTALGFCFVFGRFFLAMLPLGIGVMIETSYIALVLALSVLAFLSALLCLTLPETTGQKLLNT